MSFGVDTLGGLIEKLKQLVNDTQDNYESFFDSTQLFKQGKMDNKEYFSKMGEYLVSSSALNFLSCRIILELKSALDKGVSAKGKGERSSNSSFPSVSDPSLKSSGNGVNMGGSFGVDGFVSSGGSVGPQSPQSSSANVEYDLPMPQEAPTFKPVDIIIDKQDSSDLKGLKKNCIVCNALIPKQAKFCNKCGNSQ